MASPVRSAGVLLYRGREDSLEVFLVHPGGPFWAKKDMAVWSIPKGEYEAGENPEHAAIREFQEETGFATPLLKGILLDEAVLKSGKVITAFAYEGDVDSSAMKSNTFDMEWPPHSGVMQAFPEVDRGAWFSLEEAREKLHPAQRVFLDRLVEVLERRV